MSKIWKTILASIGPEIIVEFLVQFLASTIKNRDSAKAKKILAAVRRLRDACTLFLANFGDTMEKAIAEREMQSAGTSFQDPTA